MLRLDDESNVGRQILVGMSAWLFASWRRDWSQRPAAEMLCRATLSLGRRSFQARCDEGRSRRRSLRHSRLPSPCMNDETCIPRLLLASSLARSMPT
eukprot:6178391-Pleurochrysis_carterae.AAC.8